MIGSTRTWLRSICSALSLQKVVRDVYPRFGRWLHDVFNSTLVRSTESSFGKNSYSHLLKHLTNLLCRNQNTLLPSSSLYQVSWIGLSTEGIVSDYLIPYIVALRARGISKFAGRRGLNPCPCQVRDSYWSIPSISCWRLTTIMVTLRITPQGDPPMIGVRNG